jgi:hypothetical protein
MFRVFALCVSRGARRENNGPFPGADPPGSSRTRFKNRALLHCYFVSQPGLSLAGLPAGTQRVLPGNTWGGRSSLDHSSTGAVVCSGSFRVPAGASIGEPMPGLPRWHTQVVFQVILWVRRPAFLSEVNVLRLPLAQVWS